MAGIRKAPVRYHHGNLRAALIAAGIDIIERDGLDGLSLRAVAALAGVSHAAPQHHFPTLKALLTALATSAFERFRAALDDARQTAATGDPAAGLALFGRAYLAFVRSHPGLFRLMFSSTNLDWQDEALRTAAAGAYAELAAMARPFADALGMTTDQERTEIEYLLWSNAHGFSHLVIERLIPKPGCPPPEAMPDLGRILVAAAATLPRA